MWSAPDGSSGGSFGAGRALWSCGSMPSACELCSLINYALAANEIGLWSSLGGSLSNEEHSLLCPGTGSTPGLRRDAAPVPGQMWALPVGGVW